MIAITLAFQEQGSQQWRTEALAANAFFELDVGEVATLESSIRHSKMSDYVSVVPKSNLQHVKVTIKDGSTSDSQVISETYWNHGAAMFRHDVSTRNGIESVEVVLALLLKENPETWRTIRLYQNSLGVFENLMDIEDSDTSFVSY